MYEFDKAQSTSYKFVLNGQPVADQQTQVGNVVFTPFTTPTISEPPSSFLIADEQGTPLFGIDTDSGEYPLMYGDLFEITKPSVGDLRYPENDKDFHEAIQCTPTRQVNCSVGSKEDLQSQIESEANVCETPDLGCDFQGTRYLPANCSVTSKMSFVAKLKDDPAASYKSHFGPNTTFSAQQLTASIPTTTQLSTGPQAALTVVGMWQVTHITHFVQPEFGSFAALLGCATPGITTNLQLVFEARSATGEGSCTATINTQGPYPCYLNKTLAPITLDLAGLSTDGTYHVCLLGTSATPVCTTFSLTTAECSVLADAADGGSHNATLVDSGLLDDLATTTTTTTTPALDSTMAIVLFVVGVVALVALIMCCVCCLCGGTKGKN